MYTDPKKAYKLQMESFRKRNFLALFEEIFKQPNEDFNHKDSHEIETGQLGGSELDWQISGNIVIVQDNSQPVEPQVDEIDQLR